MGQPSDGKATAHGPRLCLRESPTIPFTVGDTATLEVGPIDRSDSLCAVRGEAIRWRSSNPRVLSVDDRGFASAVAPGHAVITATSSATQGPGASDSATFAVIPALRDVRIVPDSATLALGDSAVFRVVVTGDAPAAAVWWYSGDPAVSFARPGSKTAPASQTAESVTIWATQPGTALIEAGTRSLRDAAHVRVVVR